MNCPNCGKEMAQGHLAAAGQKILWTQRSSRLTAREKSGEEVIQAGDFWGNLHNTAYLCRDCRKVVIDY